MITTSRGRIRFAYAAVLAVALGASLPLAQQRERAETPDRHKWNLSSWR